MNDDKRLIFYIDAYSPETITLAKLADYMADFAALLGRDNVVHFAGLEKGSTKLAARVEFEDLPKVTTRLHDIRRGNPPKDAVRLFAQIDTRLANDNAIGRIFIEDGDGGEDRHSNAGFERVPGLCRSGRCRISDDPRQAVVFPHRQLRRTGGHRSRHQDFRCAAARTTKRRKPRRQQGRDQV